MPIDTGSVRGGDGQGNLVFHFTNRAPVWGAPGQTAYLILIGLNIEITFMFAIAGVAFGKMLPADKKAVDLAHPESVVSCRGRRRLLRICRDPAKLHRRTDLGVRLVERWRAVADLSVRLPDLFPGLVLGSRQGDHQEQSDCGGVHLGHRSGRHPDLWRDPGLAIEGKSE